MEDDKLLDVSKDDNMAEETQQQDSPATFSRSLLLRLGISHEKPEVEAVTNNNNIPNHSHIVIYDADYLHGAVEQIQL